MKRTPWFQARMTEEDAALMRRIEERGLKVSGYAQSSRGPFTAQAAGAVSRFVGVGRSPSEALERIASKAGVR